MPGINPVGAGGDKKKAVQGGIFAGLLTAFFDFRLFRNWKGEMNHLVVGGNVAGETIEGQCHYGLWQYLGQVPLNYLSVPVAPGWAGRKADINLSGVVIKVGYMFKF